MKPVAVLDQLLENPQRFSFFQAVRLLELRWSQSVGPQPVVGDQIRFRNSLNFGFPPSEIEALRLCPPVAGLGDAAEPDDGRPPRVEITPAFMGLLGGAGALPLVYTDQLAHRESQHKDTAARAFLDVFSNRAVTLFQQAWKKSRLHLQFESDRQNRFLPLALSLAGLGQRGLRDRFEALRDGVIDEALAYYAGALQQRTLSATQMRQILQDYLAVPVRIDQFVGRWYTVPPEGRTLLGLGQGGLLGQSAMLGDRVWQRDLRLRVALGPLDHAQFQRFLPGTVGAQALESMLTLCHGVSLEYEVNLLLRRDQVQGCSLDSTRSSTQARLGWDTFLLTGAAETDRQDVSYDIHAAA
jgi:type VI secretion system protein ImpH